ncbi:MAG: hypothetical protein WC227_01090 [Patescibacteria group bacterium]|jgi:drug/metabolite transporter (DMT)-like permease
MLFAFLASLLSAGEDIINKIILGKMKLAVQEYLPIAFAFITVISLFLAPIDFRFDSTVLSLPHLLIFVLLLASSTIWNILLAKSMKTEPLHEYEAIILTVPLATVIMAMIFLPGERNTSAIIAGIVSTLALLIFKFKKHHLNFSKTASRTALAVVFIAVEAICIKTLLVDLSPALLYFFRVFFLTIIFHIIFKPNYDILKIKPVRMGLLAASLIGATLMVLKYSAFAEIGVVHSTIILLLAPLLTYLGSYFYFKERRNFVPDLACAGVTIACIIYATLAR